MLNIKKLLALSICCAVLGETFAQGKISENNPLPLKKVSLLTSGVGYFEHEGSVRGNAEIALPFEAGAMNDALKTLVVRDEGGSGVKVSYPSENFVWETLSGLDVDLRGNPGIIDILRRQTGAALTVTYGGILPLENIAQARTVFAAGASNTASGNLLSIDERSMSVLTGSSVVVIPVITIESFAFSDAKLNADLQKALSILAENKASSLRPLTVRFEGNGARAASIAYTTPAAVWKASYRLDLASQKPFLQAWAIIDNDSANDWENVSLTLISGRPVSFVQALYPPYNVSRPYQPLEIAGAAETYAYGGAMGGAFVEESADYDAADMSYSLKSAVSGEPLNQMARAPVPAAMYDGGASGRTGGAGFAVSTASPQTQGTDSGFSFEWTFKSPVSIERGQSMMLPLTEGAVEARKVLIFNGRTANSQGTHPQAGVELTNVTGQNLPPGPIAVFDKGVYAGDALVSFLKDGEKRLLSYADDLSLTGVISGDSRYVISAAKISGGVMALTRKSVYERIYTFSSSADEEKTVIVEHPIMFNAALSEPEKSAERTANSYRFNVNIPPGRGAVFKVAEEIPTSEQVGLSRLNNASFINYASEAGIPPNIRDALRRAASLRETASAAQTAVTEADRSVQRAFQEQSRIRDNLTAAGADTDSGKTYLARLQELDAQIDALNADYEKALDESRAAERAYNDYINTLEL